MIYTGPPRTVKIMKSEGCHGLGLDVRQEMEQFWWGNIMESIHMRIEVWEDSITMDLTEICCEDRWWIALVQDRAQ
jgi:hypothetical protein